MHETTPSKWKQGIFHDGFYIYKYTCAFSIVQYTCIGMVRGGPAAHLYQIHGSLIAVDIAFMFNLLKCIAISSFADRSTRKLYVKR